MFGIKNYSQAYQLENQLLTLDPKYLSCIEYFLFNFKILRLILEGFKVTKNDDGLIYAIIAMLEPT